MSTRSSMQSQEGQCGVVASVWWVITWRCLDVVNPTQLLLQAGYIKCKTLAASHLGLQACVCTGDHTPLLSQHGEETVGNQTLLFWGVTQCLAWQVIIWVLLAQPLRDHIRTKQEQASRRHITTMPFWFPDLTSAVAAHSGPKPSVFCTHVQQCEQCVLERRQPVSDPTPKGDTPSGFLLGPYAFHETVMLDWESGSHFFWKHCVLDIM